MPNLWKAPPKTIRGLLRQYMVGAPMERIALDVMGPLPKTSQGNICVSCGRPLYKMDWGIDALLDQKTDTIVRTLLEEFIYRYGCTKEIHSDQGSNFQSNIFREVCKLLGFIERFNKSLADLVGVLLQPDQSDWDEQLAYSMMAYHSVALDNE